MEDYVPNSHVYKEKKNLPKVVQSEVKTRKKTEFSKFIAAFVSEDISNIRSYLFSDILLPAAKKVISETVDTILYGEGGRRKQSSGTKTAYGSYYNQNRDKDSPGRKTRIGYFCDEVTVEDRVEADEVLSVMDELIEQYGIASVADFYELIGVEGKHTDNQYGWKNLGDAKVVRDPDGGWTIKMPRAFPIK